MTPKNSAITRPKQGGIVERVTPENGRVMNQHFKKYGEENGTMRVKWDARKTIIPADFKAKLEEDKEISESWGNFSDAHSNVITNKKYVKNLDYFCYFHKIEEYDIMLKWNKKQIFQKVKKYMVANKGHKKGSVAVYLAVIKSYFDQNLIYFPAVALKKYLPAEQKLAGNVGFTTQDEQAMVSYYKHNLRSKAVILFFASVGGRNAAISDPPLRFKHLEAMPMGCTCVTIYADTKEEYWGFLTPEATQAVEAFKQKRINQGEEITEESFVFPAVKNSKEGYLSTQGLGKIMREGIKNAGVPRKVVYIDAKGAPQYDKSENYAHRKRFNKILKLDDSNINSNIAEKLMAHTKSLDGKHYLTDITKEECFKEFVKAIPELTVSDNSRDKVKILKLEDKVQHHTKADVMKVFEMMNISIEDLKEMAEIRQRDRKFT